MKQKEKEIRDLTLMLLYLTSWEEEEFDKKHLRTWKGYPFEILDYLRDEEKLILGSTRSKSVYLKEEAKQEAEKLLKAYRQ